MTLRADGRTPSDRSAPRSRARSAGRFRDQAMLERGARAPVVLRRAPRRACRTSASSSSATPCSASSSPTTCSATYPDLPEGELAKLRASVVNAEVLAEVAVDVELGAALRLGKGEDASGGRAKPSILADAMEAVIAAVVPRRRVGRGPRRSCCASSASGSSRAPSGPGGHDYKTRLQELAARRFDQLPRYQVRARGSRPLEAVLRDGAARGASRTGTGEGRSKKQAEQAAAARWRWRRLREHPRTRRRRRTTARRPERSTGGRCRSCLRSRSCAAISSARSSASSVEVGRGRRHAVRSAATDSRSSSRVGSTGKQDHRRRAAREVPPREARRRRRARHPPRDVGPAAPGQGARASTMRQAHPRRRSRSRRAGSCASSTRARSARCS